MPLKVMHLLSSYQYSGAEHVAVDIIRLLSAEIQAVYISPRGPIQDMLEQKHVVYQGIPAFTYRAVWQMLCEIHPDIIHAHDFRASCMAALLPFRGRIISHLHNNNNAWARDKNFRTFFYTSLLWRFHKVVVVSRPVIDEFAFSQWLKKKAIIIRNIVDEHEICCRRATLSPDEIEPIDFLFVGRLAKEKNPLRFLRLLACVKQVKPHLRAVVVGDGPLKGVMQEEIYRLGLMNCVHLVGFQENPYAYMIQADMLLLPSLWEGFGLVALEAMLLGCQVLATPVGGLPSLVGGFDEQWICQSDDDFIRQMLQPRKVERKRIQAYARQVNDIEGFKASWRSVYWGKESVS